MITVFGISNCDTIKKTLNWLKENQLEYEFHDYRKQGISLTLVNEFLDQFEIDSLINRRGTTWRKLPDSSKENLNRELAISLMSTQPAIIKRPIICNNGKWLIGLDKKAFETLLN